MFNRSLNGKQQHKLFIRKLFGGSPPSQPHSFLSEMGFIVILFVLLKMNLFFVLKKFSFLKKHKTKFTFCLSWQRITLCKLRCVFRGFFIVWINNANECKSLIYDRNSFLWFSDTWNFHVAMRILWNNWSADESGEKSTKPLIASINCFAISKFLGWKFSFRVL